MDAYQPISAKALERFCHPRNLGSMDRPDGHARITGPCGDTMEMWLRIEADVIARATFVSDGCGPSLACGSMTTELATGRSPEEANRLQQREVLNTLGGLPEDAEHCALLAVNTLKAAIADFRRTRAGLTPS